MSAVLDFRELRDKVLAGEMDEDEEPTPTPLGEEVKNTSTLLGLSAAVGIGRASVCSLPTDWPRKTRVANEFFGFGVFLVLRHGFFQFYSDLT